MKLNCILDWLLTLWQHPWNLAIYFSSTVWKHDSSNVFAGMCTITCSPPPCEFTHSQCRTEIWMQDVTSVHLQDNHWHKTSEGETVYNCLNDQTAPFTFKQVYFFPQVTPVFFIILRCMMFLMCLDNSILFGASMCSFKIMHHLYIKVKPHRLWALLTFDLQCVLYFFKLCFQKYLQHCV